MSTKHLTTRVEYRNVLNFPGYEVGDNGTVRSCWEKISQGPIGFASVMTDEWHFLKPSDMEGRPLRVVLHRDGKKFTVKVSNLVLMVFGGPRPEGMLCCHKDDNKYNNNISNLYWGTCQDNADDRVRNGRQVRGEDNAPAILTEVQVLAIRERYATDRKTTKAKLAAEHGVSITAINDIVTGRHWTHVGGPLTWRVGKRSPLNQAVADAVRREVAGGMLFREVAARHGIGRKTVSKIIHGRLFK